MSKQSNDGIDLGTALQACHDGLMSNPDLAEAFTNARQEGASKAEAHVEARQEVFGEEYEFTGATGVVADHVGVETDVGKARDEDFDYEAVDDALVEAHENSVQWGLGDDADLSKAPSIWPHSADIPDYVRRRLERVIDDPGVVWKGYEKLPPGAQARIRVILLDHMSDPDGWTLKDLVEDLSDAYEDADEDYLEGVMRNETHVVLSTAREQAYEERDDDRVYVFDWLGPDDWRTTEVCKEIKARIDDMDGYPTMEELKEILLDVAQQYEETDEGGTPNRVSEWMPHFECRHTFSRRVQSI